LASFGFVRAAASTRSSDLRCEITVAYGHALTPEIGFARSFSALARPAPGTCGRSGCPRSDLPRGPGSSDAGTAAGRNNPPNRRSRAFSQGRHNRFTGEICHTRPERERSDRLPCEKARDLLPNCQRERGLPILNYGAFPHNSSGLVPSVVRPPESVSLDQACHRCLGRD
jgi:hypothetical protein